MKKATINAFLAYVIFEVLMPLSTQGLAKQGIKNYKYILYQSCMFYIPPLLLEKFMHIFSNVTGGASWSLPHSVFSAPYAPAHPF